MSRFVLTLALFSGCAITTFAEDNPKAADVKRLAAEVADAVIKLDHEKLVDTTYEKLIEAVGGRAKMLAMLEKMAKEFKEKGITLNKCTPGDPSAFHYEGVNTFVVVPTTLEMTVPKGKVIAKSYLLGISADKGKSWKFLDGAGLDNKQARQQFLPKLPASLKLPDKQAPTLIEKP